MPKVYPIFTHSPVRQCADPCLSFSRAKTWASLTHSAELRTATLNHSPQMHANSAQISAQNLRKQPLCAAAAKTANATAKTLLAKVKAPRTGARQGENAGSGGKAVGVGGGRHILNHIFLHGLDKIQ